MVDTPNSTTVNDTLPSSPVAKPRITLPPLKRPLPKLISSYVASRGLPRLVPPTFQRDVSDDWDSLLSESSDFVVENPILDELRLSEVDVSTLAVVSPLKYLTSPHSRFLEKGLPFDWECYELAKAAAKLLDVSTEADEKLVEEARLNPNKFYNQMIALPRSSTSREFYKEWPHIGGLQGSPRPLAFWANVWRYYTAEFLPRYFSLRQACFQLDIDPVVISNDHSFAAINSRQLSQLKGCFWYATNATAREFAATRLFKPISPSAIFRVLTSLRSDAEARGELSPAFSQRRCPFNHKAELGWDLIFIGKGKLSQHLTKHYTFIARDDTVDDDVECNECHHLFASFASFLAHAPNCTFGEAQPLSDVKLPTERLILARALLCQYLQEGGRVAQTIHEELQKLHDNPPNVDPTNDTMKEDIQSMAESTLPGWLSRTTYQLHLMHTPIAYEVWAEAALLLPPKVVVHYLYYHQHRLSGDG